MGPRPAPPRSNSIPKQLVLRESDQATLRPLIVEKHYLRSWPASVVLALGVYLHDQLVGAVVFTVATKNGHRILVAGRPRDVATLARLYLIDEMPSNSESRVIAMALRYLSKHRNVRLVISYADGSAGHFGYVYQSSNWRYVGMSDETSYIRLSDGKLHHPRTVHTVYGSNHAAHLRRTGIPAVRVNVPPKFKYLYVLDPAWAFRVKARPQPYPKLNGRGPPRRSGSGQRDKQAS